ncbi:NAD(P)/FAD-dependent oxidoreductase [Halotalea alkalilenta]|uniref:NAD(P)/FAD-dependent oxidoreductase n=1 Tax=Halotalea alkalilenta TaxID=376489 RepID=UPI001CBE12B9|nr:FAD-dependent oxidoreductase [Halotalea alkalilenta]
MSDAIVIGAGIIGASCAHALALAGLSVRVVDAGLPAATAAGMGHLVSLDGNAAELALCSDSLTRWRALAPSLPASGAYHRCGTLWLAENEDDLATADDKRAALAMAGIGSELINPTRLAALEPLLRPGLSGALRVESDAILYAPRVADWLLESVGITLERAQVAALEDQKVYLADGRRLGAQVIVLAAGLQAGALLEGLPIAAKKGHLLITDRYPGRISHQLVELGYGASAHSGQGTSVAFNLQARPTGQLLIGSTRQFDTLDPCVEPALLARMLERARGYLPALGELNAIRAWTGFRAATPDGLPIIGRHPEREGLWLALGHEGLGVTTAPSTAALIRAEVLGEHPPLDPLPYRFERFQASAPAAAEGRR